MEHDSKPSEINLTEEEIGRFTKAFKDENFRKMLRDYAEEISDPENRKKYEEEIAILEKERGNNVQFVNPTPFKCIKTSVNGKNKCYVNICANDKIGRPSCTLGQSQDGVTGHHWSLPHILHPERKELDPKGNKILIYDVIFHPDTLHMATTNNHFMDMVTTVAIESIQDGLDVSLDKNNIKNMTTKYKGNPKACVIRKPISGFKASKATDDPDPLAFPYPDDKATNSKKEERKKSPCRPLDDAQGPTTPHYTLKYRSFVDLQDFRCSRDSGPSPRPKEIILTIDLPLLKSVAAVNLEVKERSILLESEKPDYKLELSLPYGVDEDKGAAKFNKQTRQLLVTLPVRPPGEYLQWNSTGLTSAEDTQSSGGVFGESEVEQGDTGHADEETAGESQENTAAEETKDMCQRDEERAEVGTDLSLQDGTKLQEHGRGDELQQIGPVTRQESREKKQVETVAVEEKVQETDDQKIQTGDSSSEETAAESQQNSAAEEETKDMCQRDEERAEVGTDLSLQDGTKMEEHGRGDELQQIGPVTRQESCEKKQVETVAVEEKVQETDDPKIQTGDRSSEETAAESQQNTAEEETKEMTQRDEKSAEVGNDLSLQDGTKVWEMHQFRNETKQEVQTCERKRVETVVVKEKVQETDDTKIQIGDSSSEETAAESQQNTAEEETKEMTQRDEESAEVGPQDGTKIEEIHQFGKETKQEAQSCEKKRVETVEVEEKAQTMDNQNIHISKSEKTQSEKASEDQRGASDHNTAAEGKDEEIQKPERDFANSNVPPVLLREVREDGSQRIISDHVTTAGFSILNSLMFELD